MKNLFFIFFCFIIQSRATAQCNYIWARWEDQGHTDTAQGSINVNGAIVNIRMMANYNFDFTPDIYNYPAFNGYSDAPNNDTVPRTNWASGAAATTGVTTMCFSPPVTDPVLLLSSVGSAWITVSLEFSSPYNVLYDGGGNIYVNNTTLEGHEGFSILEFPGTISCITVFSTTPENFTNLTWGVKNPLTADFTYTNVCQNNSIAFSSAASSINSPGTLTGYHWDFGDGNTSLLANPQHSYSAPGTYLVELVVTADNNCTDTISRSVTVNSSYSNFNSVNLCSGQSYQVNSHVYSATGLYYDTLYTIAGCDSVIVTDLTVNAIASSVNPQAICAGGSYSINSHVYTSAGIYFDTLHSATGCDSLVITQLTSMQYYTSGNLQTLCQGESYTFNSHVYNTSGIYYDTLHSASGCDSIIITSLTVKPLPVISFLHPPDLCIDANAIVLNYAFPAGGTYSGPGVTNAIFDPQAASAGTHQLTYTYTDSVTSCMNTTTGNITVRPLPTAKLSVTPDHAQLPDSKISFVNLSPGVTGADWDFGDGTYSANQNGIHVYGDTGHFNITLTVTDLFGCMDVTEITVFIDSEFSFYVPNAFTPDGDGINDYFSGRGAGISEYRMTIFNRWGEEIFNTTDINTPWNGKNVQDDTYVYKINLSDALGTSHEYTGRVTVIR